MGGDDMVPGPERDRSGVLGGLVGIAEVFLEISREDGKGRGVFPEELDGPPTGSEAAVRDPGVILDDEGGGFEEEVSGLGKFTPVQKVGGGLQIGGSPSEASEPGEEAAAFRTVGKVGLKVVKRL